MPFTIVRQDITKMHVDAIVNAANASLRMGGGVCGAIFQAAGAQELQRACDRLGPIQTGEAAITPGFALPARFVIHAVGPVYHAYSRAQAAALLRAAYTHSLELAVQHECASIAFPLISSGIYGYPKDAALQEATAAITAFLMEHELDVYLVVFDRASFQVSRQLLGAVDSYIDQHYVDTHHMLRRSSWEWASAAPAMAARPALDDWLTRMDEPFADTLFRLIDSRGKTDVEVYKKANIDRKLFSKIRSVKGYTPKKPTILALAVALELTLAETNDLLKRAGYALSHASKFDVIVEYFIVNGNYNIYDINQVLFAYDQPLLGA